MWEGGYVSRGLWDRDDMKMPIVNINLQYYNTNIFKQLAVDEQSNSSFISLARHLFKPKFASENNKILLDTMQYVCLVLMI